MVGSHSRSILSPFYRNIILIHLKYNINLKDVIVMRDIVYHYCSIDTFFSIIHNSTLRLSDINKVNDYSERKWILNKNFSGIEKDICST